MKFESIWVILSVVCMAVLSLAGCDDPALRPALEQGGGEVNPSPDIRPPVASAGADQNVKTGAVVELDGSRSTVAEGRQLSYDWAFVSRPSGSGASLSSTTAAKPTFVPDVDGSYVLRLVVGDGETQSAASRVTVTATAPAVNAPPVAHAGDNQEVTTGARVTLDGSRSSDADGDQLFYRWRFKSLPPRSGASLSSLSVPRPSFTADVDGRYVVGLVVNDGLADSAEAEVAITAVPANSPPVAHAGDNQNVTVGATVTLDGSRSNDANRDPLSYRWHFVSRPSGSNAVLTAPNTVRPTFVADRPGNYVLGLVVNDGKVDSTEARVTITAAVVNSPPVAHAGDDQNVAAGSTVTLDGSRSSDADGNPLSYRWSFISRPPGSNAQLSGDTAVRPTFVADVEGSYVLRLIVNDGTADSAEARVTITAAVVNSPPVAHAGDDQSVAPGSTVTLDGSRSSDADGNPLSYRWSFVSRPPGSNAQLSGDTAVRPTFVADVEGSYVLRLIVNDGTADSAEARVTITAAVVNSPPVAHAGDDQRVRVNTRVTLDGSRSSDADGDPLTYLWHFISVPGNSFVFFSDENSIRPTFVPDVTGNYVVGLTVSDGKSQSAVARVTINATPASSRPGGNDSDDSDDSD